MGYRIWRLMLLVLFASGWLAGCSLVPISAPEVPADEAAVRHEVVMQAMSLLKTDYRWGGAHPEQGLDCSGLVRYVYRQAAAIELPHNAHAIAKQTRSIRREELQPGDLVFFNTLKRPYSHVGIYIGEGRFIHAPKAGSEVKISSLGSSYFAKRFEGAGSLLRR
jgi:cell wall-associated NlpC family hydrolase